MKTVLNYTLSIDQKQS